MITERSVATFLDELASGAPTPGGGSAAAIIGAMGAALLSMVCNVTIGKKGQEAVEPDMKAVRDETEKLRAALTVMVADDIAAFDGLMTAYRLPKSSEEEKSRRAEAIQANLRAATETPLACARACAAVVAQSRRAAEKGFAGVVSDAGVGVLAANSALRSAALNVYINAPSIQDRAYALAATTEIEKLLDQCARESESVFALVRSRLG
ncbi:MAG TPA: cyclodeaminase/cyclohydrolase family protein [Steroidobacteraceae bacterium]|nr:cyclodeaminase/cyclohydrolase family protein [Steroidobacteraceae bacterium]